jgi:hypothetical protein
MHRLREFALAFDARSEPGIARDCGIDRGGRRRIESRSTLCISICRSTSSRGPHTPPARGFRSIASSCSRARASRLVDSADRNAEHLRGFLVRKSSTRRAPPRSVAHRLAGRSR